MECPVCNTKELSQNEVRCPKCNSDLEALHLSSKIKQDSRNKLIYGIIISILFIAVLIIYILSILSKPTEEITSVSQPEMEQMQTQLQNQKSQNESLKTENEKLKKQLSELKKEKEARTKEYIVQNGESLFTIARKIYGNGFRYVDIAKDNNIEDPNNIKTGQKLIIHY